jgi:hypothetical protein
MLKPHLVADTYPLTCTSKIPKGLIEIEPTLVETLAKKNLRIKIAKLILSCDKIHFQLETRRIVLMQNIHKLLEKAQLLNSGLKTSAFFTEWKFLRQTKTFLTLHNSIQELISIYTRKQMKDLKIEEKKKADLQKAKQLAIDKSAAVVSQTDIDVLTKKFNKLKTTILNSSKKDHPKTLAPSSGKNTPSAKLTAQKSKKRKNTSGSAPNKRKQKTKGELSIKK